VQQLITASTIHALIGGLMVAILMAHIYIGSVGMEGASKAMTDGQVDLNWAKEHHNLWVKDVQNAAKATPTQ
jgi:formate dehydrogenase subunit gamma